MDHRQQEVLSRAKSLRQRFADSRTSASSSLSTSPLPIARWQHNKLPTSSTMDYGGVGGVGGLSAGFGCGFGDFTGASLSPRSAGILQKQSSYESELLLSSSPRVGVRRSGGGSELSTPAGSKSPSPSRAANKGADKRPSSVSWMMTSPRRECSRPATPTAGYPLTESCTISTVAAAAAAVAAATSTAQQVRQMSDDFAADLVVDANFLHNSKVINHFVFNVRICDIEFRSPF